MEHDGESIETISVSANSHEIRTLTHLISFTAVVELLTLLQSLSDLRTAQANDKQL
jgi:hypothetical protein